MPQNNDIATQWKGLTPQQRDLAMSKMTPDQRSQLAGSLGFKRPKDSVRATPDPWSASGIKGRLMTWRDWAVDQLPAVGGFAGGMVGLGAGVETGPGALGSAALGATAGGGLGEAAHQGLTQHFHPEDKHMTPWESGSKIAIASASQGLQELGGQVVGRVAGRVANAAGTHFISDAAFARYPILKDVFAVGEHASPRAAQHLTAAASNKGNAGVTLEAVTRTLGDLEQEITKLPVKERTIGGFLKAVNSRKDAMNAESGVAMLPIAGNKTMPGGVAQNILKLIRPEMTQTAEGRAEKRAIFNAAKDFQKPWTFRQLDSMRTQLATQLAKHNAQGSVARYTAEKGDLDLAIDNAILDGLRESVYPEMDRAANKAAGYFENLKGRQSSLITLQQVLDKRVKDLSGSQAISEVAPRFSSENFSGSLHAGSAPRLGVYGIRQALSPTRELNEASKHVAKAFPAVDTLPYQVLLSGEVRAAQLPAPKNPTDEWQEQPGAAPAPRRPVTKLVHESEDAALPPQIQRIENGLQVKYVPGKPFAGNGGDAIASVGDNEPRTVEINDPEKFKRGPMQTRGHEIVHLWRNNLPAPIKKMALPDNASDPYNISNVDQLRSKGYTLATIPQEQAAMIVQTYIADPSQRKKLQPWIDDMDKIPMSVMNGTSPDQPGINTTVRAPMPPSSAYAAPAPRPQKPH